MTTIKALALWQPWASAVVTKIPETIIYAPTGESIPVPKNIGPYIKQWETRPWKTEYRGPLLIHASKSAVELASVKNIFPIKQFLPCMGELTYGAIIGIVELVDVITTEEWKERYLDVDSDRYAIEYGFGDYSGGRYAWELKNPVKFDTPMPYKGLQRFFNVPKSDLIMHEMNFPPTSKENIDWSKFLNETSSYDRG